ncbi:1-acyl-sn-glycerol-3-phosphate acyltransferase [Clostridium sp. CAG:575]|nr:1-acyl-sn-glycerol-3-phosphate acyltransferase [Clostridium sp. CAG:575]
MKTQRKLIDILNKDKKDKEEVIEKSQYRVDVLKKIEKLEEEGKFDVDAEDDPPTIVLTPEDIDYLRTKMTSKIKRVFANKVGERFLDNLLKNNKLIIKEIRGIENLSKVTTGAIVTCNHFNPFDSFTIEKVFRISGKIEEKKLYKVIREGNYTNFPGLYGFFFRNCDTLPLSSNKRTMIEFMKAVDTLLQNGDFILIYPEQSLWWNYRKPKPLKPGAFKFASRNNVPVIPIFITMEDSDIIGEDGFPVQEYIVNISEPIYPDENLTEKQNTERLLNQNFEIWKNIYENFYGIPLAYTTKKSDESSEKEIINK